MFIYHTVLRDYCLFDYFSADCPTGSVILMEEALYGRMQLGTCLTRDIGFMDCSRYVLMLSRAMRYPILHFRRCFWNFIAIAIVLSICIPLHRDVLLLMDRFCSGQHSCRFKVAQLEEFTSPCPSDMVSYLQARYTCLEGGWVSTFRIGPFVQNNQ